MKFEKFEKILHFLKLKNFRWLYKPTGELFIIISKFAKYYFHEWIIFENFSEFKLQKLQFFSKEYMFVENISDGPTNPYESCLRLFPILRNII